MEQALPIPQVHFTVTPPVRDALARIGRTEDVRFAPSNRRLAIAGFAKHMLLFLEIEIREAGGAIEIAATDFLELTSPDVRYVHGLDYIDEERLVVANRDAKVTILRLPSGPFAGRQVSVKPIRRISGSPFARVRTPGSVAVARRGTGWFSLLVCNNYARMVTEHIVAKPIGYSPVISRLAFQHGLEIPDGVAVSHDGRWAAISSHDTNDVKIFATSRLGSTVEPIGVLAKANYPHGLRFTADDRHVLVADAGDRVVHVYERGAGWEGTREPARSITVIDEAAFLRGRHNPQEGGPKGLDIDRSNRIVATTCEEQTLAFFALPSFLGNG